MSNLLRKEDLTAEQRRLSAVKAGSVKSLAKKLSQRKWCTARCPIYGRCWAKFIKNEKGGRQQCSLNQMPKRVVQRTTRLYEKGEEGFRDEMTDMLIRFSNDVELSTDPDFKRKFLYELRECMKVLHGDKKKVEHSGLGNITFIVNKPEGDLPDIDFEKKRAIDGEFEEVKNDNSK